MQEEEAEEDMGEGEEEEETEGRDSRRTEEGGRKGEAEMALLGEEALGANPDVLRVESLPCFLEENEPTFVIKKLTNNESVSAASKSKASFSCLKMEGANMRPKFLESIFVA
eukprot:CAMPEP_0201508238 /NCGR_PEP_ID=MMETSP0161_2-20130828/1660_1 /ASSEMBLY_ACC=CAM_ASM_000251 /TAXON_ID=180227 /ORGANISM="Neoparamoeba aestuarina, Strain SoJaBio B1-5/56/2" /LENGTH=111 /DNA_ID=CAMNT_0047902829 /DNA_START=356 /DNA_END=691 /DNA_ORIENTATION=-